MRKFTTAPEDETVHLSEDTEYAEENERING
jgi:hypothetical protein